jgi:hypothetical protein
MNSRLGLLYWYFFVFLFIFSLIFYSPIVFSQTISGVINTYAPVTAIGFNTGSGVTNCTSVRLTIGATTGSATPFAVGDRVLVMQMQGSRPNLQNNASFGSVPITPTVDAFLSNAGSFEYNTINAISGSNITLSSPLLNNYDVEGSVQLVRVPVYTMATTVAAANVTASQWNGSSGGIVALICTNTLTLTGNISADGAGFAGGAAVGGGTNTCRTNFFFNSATAQGAEKGDGVPIENPNFARGKGAWGNGGGGGNGDNNVANGGGGGANGAVGGNGGQGNACNQGGIAGYALAPSNTRIFMGGGGGGGFGTSGGAGARGGGIVLINTQDLAGTGNITALGSNGANGASNGAGGGGGAGGSVYLNIGSGTNSGAKTINVSGGNGGSGNGSGGGGGGGGGGVIRTNVIGGTAITRTLSAGTGGARGGSGTSANGVNGTTSTVNQTNLSINTNPSCTATINDIASLCDPLGTLGDEAYPAGSFGAVTNTNEVVATSGGFGNNWNGIRFKTNVSPWNTFAPGYTFRTPAGSAMTTPSDGEYAIGTGSVGSYSATQWITIPDRSSNGFMMIVNSSYQPSIIFNQDISGLCEGVKYQFSVYLRNLDPGNLRSFTNQTGTADYGPIGSVTDAQKVFSTTYTGQGGSGSRVCPDVEFLINDAVVATTGPIPNNSNGLNGASGANTQWIQYGVTFRTILGGTVNLKLRNTAPGGGGNDIAVDDISFRPCGPAVGLVTNAPNCVPPMITANVGADFSTPQYQWQSSTDNGANWSNIGTNNNSYVIPTPSNQNTIFRVIVANSTSSLASAQCRIVTPSIGNFCNLLLPVTLLYFDAIQQGEKVKISWATVTEDENDYFEVERSRDGINFTPIGKVQGKGNSKIRQEYGLIDNAPLKDINYYRLKQVDKDGKTTYFKIVAVNMDCFDCEIISIYPNPSSSGIFTIIQNLDKEEGRAFSITNALGIIISEGKINQLSNIIDLSSQPKGVYFFTIRFPKENKVYKLVID